jgi:2-(3-amino-3-carboxypropyl)histidine synthase
LSMEYDICEQYELQGIDQIIKHPGRILVTAPDGLKPLYRCILGGSERRGIEFSLIFSMQPSYGACDLPVDEIEALKPSLIIHIGHNRYPFLAYEPKTRIVYIPAYYKSTLSPTEEEQIAGILSERGIKRVGILGTIQHARLIPVIAERLQSRGIHAMIGKPRYSWMEQGQILGCEVSAAEAVNDSVEGFLVVAGGYFHATGVYLATGKPVIIYDPYRGIVEDYTRKAYSVLAKRYYMIEEAKEKGRRVGIIMGTTPGQYRPAIVGRLVTEGSRMGYQHTLLVSRYLDMDRLISIDNGLGLDFYVVTSCPRLPIDDLSEFYKPVLTPGEYRMIIENKSGYIFPW